jgi:hypothetical protein
MSTYTAIVADIASVGASVIGVADPSNTATSRRNPAVASARIRNVQAPHIVSDQIGGLLSCDFAIPPQEAQLYRPVLRYGAAVWLFDGATPIFVGVAEKPTWGTDGSALMNVNGPWLLLQQARMREIWDLWDMTAVQKGTGANENKAGQFTQNSDGSVTFSFPNGTTVQNSDRVSVDYLLFGEVSGGHDYKTITAFEFDITDAQGLAANRRLRVIGKSTAAAAGGDLLYDTGAAGTSQRQGALNLNGVNQGSVQWPVTSGYRCLRFQYIYTQAGSVTLIQDNYVTLDRIRVSTREAMFPTVGGVMDTAAIARDILTLKALAGSPIIASYDMPAEFWRSSQGGAGHADTNTMLYRWGLDPTTGTGSAPNSGVGINGFSSLEWKSPTDILEELVALDGCQVGFYLPYNGRSGYDPPGNYIFGGSNNDAGSFWLGAPPQLVYEAFPDPIYAPDYTVHTKEGAQVELDTSAQPLIDVEYVNYNTLKGRQLSVVTEDMSTLNYLRAQGFRRAEDYTIQPSVGDQTTAAALGQQVLATRRQPYAAATITIELDGASRYPILKGGAQVAKLATVRPSSMHIVDVPGSSGLRAGYATHIEWWGQTPSAPEKLQITLGQPGQKTTQQAIGHLAHRMLKRQRRNWLP